MELPDAERKIRFAVVTAYCIASVALLAAYDVVGALSAMGVLHLPTTSPIWMIPQISTRLVALGGLSYLLLVELGPDRKRDVLFTVIIIAVVYGLAAGIAMTPITRKTLAESMDKAMDTLKSQMSEEQAVRARTSLYSVGVMTSVILKPVGLAALALISYFIAKAIAKPAEDRSPQGDE